MPGGDAETSEDGSELWFYLRDHLGSVVATLNSSSVLERKDKLPYGEHWFSDAPAATDRDFNGNLKEGMLLDYNARHYLPEIGKFIQADSIIPKTDGVGFNRYAYVSNNPVNRIDPSGHAETLPLNSNLSFTFTTRGFAAWETRTAGLFNQLYSSRPELFAGMNGNWEVRGAHPSQIPHRAAGFVEHKRSLIWLDYTKHPAKGDLLYSDVAAEHELGHAASRFSRWLWTSESRAAGFVGKHGGFFVDEFLADRAAYLSKLGRGAESFLTRGETLSGRGFGAYAFNVQTSAGSANILLRGAAIFVDAAPFLGLLGTIAPVGIAQVHTSMAFEGLNQFMETAEIDFTSLQADVGLCAACHQVLLPASQMSFGDAQSRFGHLSGMGQLSQ